jgi:hypothetical protein
MIKIIIINVAIFIGVCFCWICAVAFLQFGQMEHSEAVTRACTPGEAPVNVGFLVSQDSCLDSPGRVLFWTVLWWVLAVLCFLLPLALFARSWFLEHIVEKARTDRMPRRRRHGGALVASFILLVVGGLIVWNDTIESYGKPSVAPLNQAVLGGSVMAFDRQLGPQKVVSSGYFEGRGYPFSWSYNTCDRAAPPHGELRIGTPWESWDPITSIDYATCGDTPLTADWPADARRYFPPDWKLGDNALNPTVQGQCYTSALFEARNIISLPGCSFSVYKNDDMSWTINGT